MLYLASGWSFKIKILHYWILSASWRLFVSHLHRHMTSKNSTILFEIIKLCKHRSVPSLDVASHDLALYFHILWQYSHKVICKIRFSISYRDSDDPNSGYCTNFDHIVLCRVRSLSWRATPPGSTTCSWCSMTSRRASTSAPFCPPQQEQRRRASLRCT